jgi:hypothetical protein
MAQFRQGDVLIISVDELSKELCITTINPIGVNHVLAYGEATGHCHAINKNECELYGVNDNIIALAKKYGITESRAITHGLRIVVDNARLRHGTPAQLFRDPDHTDIKLPKGDYLVIRPREYSDEDEFKVIAD